MTKIKVVSDNLRDVAGCVTWWSLTGNISASRLQEACSALGYREEDLPQLPSNQCALRRALRQYEGPRSLVRSLPDGAFAVVEESYVDSDGRSDVEFTTKFRAWIDSDCAVVDTDNGEIEDAVDILFERAKVTYEAQDLSSWFVEVVGKLRAVPLRERGGIYFVPEESAKRWSNFADMIKTVSASRIYEIPAMHNERAVEAVLDALVREARSEADAMAEQLNEGRLGVRALNARRVKLGELASKVAAYERLLGVKLIDIQSAFEELQGRAVQAILTLEAAE